MLSYLRRICLPVLALAAALLLYGVRGSLGAPAQEHSRGAAAEHAPQPAEHAPQPGDHAAKPGDHPEAHAPAHAKKAEPSAMEHVLDNEIWHMFDYFWPQHIHLPAISLGFYTFQITKYMVLEVIACLLIMVIYIPLARQLQTGEPARGWFANTFEVLLTFVRDQIAKPTLGTDHADRFVPFLWTMFLFILFNNLLGMIPFLGSATASIFVTGALALIVFFAIHGSAIVVMGTAPAHGHDDHHEQHPDTHGHGTHGHQHTEETAPANSIAMLLRGAGRYIQSYWPQIDLPAWGLPIKALVFFLEIMGVVVRNGVLAIRLFANMFAGHMVLATILLFIQMSASAPVALWGTITVSSVLGIVLLSLLEIFVAFLQAYIFVFLASLFIGMAIAPQH